MTALEQTLDILASHNQGIRFLITVSPVASAATFSDSDVVSRSFANKCLLRAVVEEVVRKRPTTAYYFPSFEMVLCHNPSSFMADNRHVKRRAVRRIFGVLERSTGLAGR